MQLLFIQLVLISAGITQAPGPSGNDSDLLDRIIRNWEERQQSFPRFRCFVSEERFFPKDSIGRDYDNESDLSSYPSQDTTTKGQMRYLVDIKTGRFRIETDSEIFYLPFKQFIREFKIETFNGNEYRIYRPKDKNPIFKDSRLDVEMGISNKLELTMVFRPEDYPILFACGVLPTGTMDFSRANKIFLPVPRGVQVQSKALYNGKECLIVRCTTNIPGQYVDFWIDQSNKSTIVRANYYLSYKVDLHIEIQYGYKGDMTIPSKWTVETYSNKTGFLKGRVTRTMLECNLKTVMNEDEFIIKYEPKMLVLNTEKTKKYRVGDDGKELIPISFGTNSQIEESSNWLYIIVGCILLVAILVYFTSRFARKRFFSSQFPNKGG